jgi:hypothetical protein
LVGLLAGCNTHVPGGETSRRIATDRGAVDGSPTDGDEDADGIEWLESAEAEFYRED